MAAAALRRRAPATAAALARGASAAAPAAPAILAEWGPLASSAAVFGAANGAGLAISLATGSHLHLDLIGTGAFAVSAFNMRGTGCVRQTLSAGIVSIWATKLACFLTARAQVTRHDARLDGTLSTASGTVGFWVASWLWGWVVSLPHTLAAGVPVVGRPPVASAHLAASLALCALGLAVETAADAQKWAFKTDPATRGQNCDVGLWRLSQHPNWAGNLLLWLGVLALNAPVLRAGGWKRVLGACASPIFLALLFHGQATGGIANAVELAQAKYGTHAGFRKYVQATPLIFPAPGALLAALGGGARKEE